MTESRTALFSRGSVFDATFEPGEGLEEGLEEGLVKAVSLSMVCVYSRGLLGCVFCEVGDLFAVGLLFVFPAVRAVRALRYGCSSPFSMYLFSFLSLDFYLTAAHLSTGVSMGAEAETLILCRVAMDKPKESHELILSCLREIYFLHPRESGD